MVTQVGQVSPDGLWTWNGSQWVPAGSPVLLSPDGRWSWNGQRWVANPANLMAGAGNPPGLVLFRGYCIVVCVFTLSIGGLGMLGLGIHGFDPGQLDTSLVAVVISTLIFGYALVEGIVALVAVLSPRRPWGWVVGLIAIILGVGGITIVVAIPLLVFWSRSEMRSFYRFRT